MGKKITLKQLEKKIKNAKPSDYTWKDTKAAHDSMVSIQQKVLKDFGISKKRSK